MFLILGFTGSGCIVASGVSVSAAESNQDRTEEPTEEEPLFDYCGSSHTSPYSSTARESPSPAHPSPVRTLPGMSQLHSGLAALLMDDTNDARHGSMWSSLQMPKSLPYSI
jgi:hypothetical protein